MLRFSHRVPLWPQANLTKASSGEHDNQPLIEEILQLRAEMAGLLGFDSYASVSTSEKMAQTTGSVMKQTEELRAKALPAAAAELETLRAFVRPRNPRLACCASHHRWASNSWQIC